MAAYFLPTDTASHAKRYAQACQHLGLRLEKYIPGSVIEKDTGEERFAWMKEVAAAWNRGADDQLWQHASDRWAAMVSDLGAAQWTMTLIDRLIVGLGQNTVLETGLTIHHTWGIPVVSGSALKGLARAWATVEGKEGCEAIFGSEPGATPLKIGDVTFLDALPTAGAGRVELAVDIMNPHYSDYYRDPRQPPADYLNPIPIFFLTVRGGSWRFGVAPRRGAPPERVQQSTERAREWLVEALQFLGAGGKTSAGYGYFQPQPSNQTLSKAVRAANAKQTALREIPGQLTPSTARMQPPTDTPIRTSLTILRIDANRSVYRVEPRQDALLKIARQHNLSLDQLHAPSTRWFLRIAAFPQPYTKRATTPACVVDRIEQAQGTLVIWMKPAPKTSAAE